MERIAIFAALPWECRTALHCLRQARRTRIGEFTVWQGHTGQREVWVVKTGMGVQRAGAAVDAACAAETFAMIVSTGCAGGLASVLAPGDLTVATVVSGDGIDGAMATAVEPRARALNAAREAGLRAVEGPLLCSATVLATVDDKRAAADTGAIVVEMEGGAVATRAAKAGIPFLSVRAILDGADHAIELPPLVDPVSGGTRPLALATYLAANPRAIGDLMALQRMQRAARDSLERFFKRWLSGPI